MTKQSKGRFSKKGKSILHPDPPLKIGDLLPSQDDLSKDVKTSIRQDVDTTTRIDENTEIRQTKIIKNKKKQRVRHELRLPYELSEKLRKYVFKNRTTKTAVMEKALTLFLNDK